ncbi:MAG: hypothetical protein GY869_02840 [Planctomycetes bacterium]|nr:hypothetical protein [Planctomycetota bacterium]
MSETSIIDSDQNGVKTSAVKMGGWVLAILMVALFLRVGWLFYSRPAPVSDFMQYKILAENLWDKHFFGYEEPTALRMPGFPLFLAGCMLVSRSDLWLGFMNVLVSVLLCAEVFFLAGKMLDWKAAFWACILCVFNPAFIFFSPVLASESLYSGLLIGSLILVWPDRQSRIWRVGLSGLLLGMAILVRGSGLFYIPVVLGLTFWHEKENGKDRRVAPLAKGGLVILMIICCLAPWYVRNVKVFGGGAGLSTVAGRNFYYAHNAGMYGYFMLPAEVFGGLNEVEVQDKAYRLGWEYLQANPATLLESVWRGTVMLYEPSTYGINWSTREGWDPQQGWIDKDLPGRRVFWYISIGAYGLLLIGVLLSPITRREWTRLSVLVIGSMIFLNWLCYAVVFIGIARYHYLPELFFCIIAGAVISKLCWRKSYAKTQ